MPDSSRCYGVRFFAERVDDDGEEDGAGSPAAAAVLQRAVVWDGIGTE